MSKEHTDELRVFSISPSSFTIEGNYTNPKTWGVYKVEVPSSQGQAKRFRYGNHPVRLYELAIEFPGASLIALFDNRELAKELADRLND